VLTGRDVPRESWTDGLPPESLATSIPGVFAVGDTRAGSTKRVAAASGEGSSVVTLVHAHLAVTRDIDQPADAEPQTPATSNEAP
jgi:thioredoxin reductase (NADPH)